MATGRITLLEIQKLKDNDEVVGLIEENIAAVPEVEAFPMRTISGTTYKTSLRVGLPKTGFRSANEGQDPGKSEFDNKTVTCEIFGGNVEADVAIADSHEDGAEAYQMIESSGVMLSALLNIGRQIWEGVVNDAKGFPGLRAALPFDGVTTVGGDALCIDAGGEAANTGTNVYAVRFGSQDCELVGGQNDAFTLGDFYKQMVSDSEGKRFEAYVAALNAWIGFAILSENAARRITNLTAETDHTMTTDLVDDILELFPVGHKPNALFMTRRSMKQLRKSMSIVNVVNGRPIFGRTPSVAEAIKELKDGYNVETYVTDCIPNNSAIETAE